MSTSAVPRVDSFIFLSDRRRISYAEWGDPDGAPIILAHGMPGSRLVCPDVAATTAGGVRLITIDRPGYGGSDPFPQHSIAEWADDVIELLDYLKIDACSVVGWSAGGRYALACGYHAPERFPKIGAIACPGPVDQIPRALAEMPEAIVDLQRRAREGDPSVRAKVEEAMSWYPDDPARFMQMALDNPHDPDRTHFLIPAIATTMQRMWEEGARQGIAGYLSDWLALAEGWGFGLTEVRSEVHLWHGDADLIVPHYHAEHLVAHLPDARLTTYPGEGHLIAIPHWASILTDLVLSRT